MRELRAKALIAMIAVPPLPGSPSYCGSEEAVMAGVLADLHQYTDAGVDAVMLENSFDLPYIKPPLPREAVSLMRAIASEVRARFSGPIGVQLLEAANIDALHVAAAARLDFVRVEGYVFAHVGGAGLIEGCAGLLHRERARLNRQDVRFFADIKKKHCSHALTADLGVDDVAKQAAFFLADGLVVTGPRTGEAPLARDLEKVREASALPILIGSGMTAENLPRYVPLADMFIVGSCFREQGNFLGRLDRRRLDAFLRVFHRLR